MTTTDANAGDAPAPRKRGAPKGNRNAWKHGGRSAAAKAGRKAARERVVACLPDAGVFVQIARRHEPEIKRLGWDAELARIESNKTNNSVSQAKEGEGDPPSIFSTNKTNNSVAHDGPRKRGAPKGNRNALKHGFRSGKRREFSSGLRNFLRRVDAMCKLAHAMASGGRAR
ncbi:MAG: hypothetical protein ACJ8EL_02100 [Rhizomicrobium sp.]